MPMPNITSQDKYLILSQRLPSGEVIDNRIVIQFDPRAWSMVEDKVRLNARFTTDEPLHPLMYSHSVYWGAAPEPVMFTKAKLKPIDAEIDCEIRSMDTHFELCLCNGDFGEIEAYAKLLVKAVGKYVLTAGTWRMLCELPSPEESKNHPQVR